MLNGRTVAYCYDGSLDGLLCCVFESYTRREIPVDIQSEDEPQATLYQVENIPTVPEHAERVYRSLTARICPQAEFLVTRCFLSCVPDRAMLIYRFIRLGYQHGAKVVNMLADDTVSAVQKAAKAVGNEAHLSLEFLRFSEYNGALMATISPKNNVLALLGPHFCNRFPEERFLIYDDTHGMALVYRPYEAEIIPVESIALPPPDEVELRYRKLWTQYYNTIAIESRYNPKCRMTHMPKRFWHNMTEFQTPTPAGLGTAEPATLPLPLFNNVELVIQAKNTEKT